MERDTAVAYPVRPAMARATCSCRYRWAQQDEKLPLADLHGDVVDDGNALIALGNLVEGDGHGRPWCCYR